jgi:hypothetical protein
VGQEPAAGYVEYQYDIDVWELPGALGELG